MPLFMVDAEPAHVLGLCEDARPVDTEEWVAASGQRLADSLLHVLATGNKDMARAIVDSDTCRCLLMFGATATVNPGVGNAWLVASNAAYRRVKSIHRHFADGLGLLHARYPTLDAWTYHKNHAHQHWMEHYGFAKTGDMLQLGMGFTFLLYRRTRDTSHAADAAQVRPGAGGFDPPAQTQQAEYRVEADVPRRERDARCAD